MLDYKDIITKHYALGMSGMVIAKSLEVSVSGVNDFLRAFKECKTLGYPLPQGITNYGIAEAVCGKSPGGAGRDLSYNGSFLIDTAAKVCSWAGNDFFRDIQNTVLQLIFPCQTGYFSQDSCLISWILVSNLCIAGSSHLQLFTTVLLSLCEVVFCFFGGMPLCIHPQSRAVLLLSRSTGTFCNNQQCSNKQHDRCATR